MMTVWMPVLLVAEAAPVSARDTNDKPTARPMLISVPAMAGRPTAAAIATPIIAIHDHL